MVSKYKAALGLENTGAEKYLFKNKDRTPLITNMVSGLIRKVFGIQKGTFGEGRLFRNTIESWGDKRYKGEEAWKTDIIDGVIVGHGEQKTMKQTYSKKLKKEGGLDKVVNKIIEQSNLFSKMLIKNSIFYLNKYSSNF